MGFRFEQLEVWKLAIDFASHVYEVTEDFPRSEVFGLRSDIRRAGNSVPMPYAICHEQSVRIAYGVLLMANDRIEPYAIRHRP